MECKTPGKKIRSKGQGRGQAVGQGKGPIGVPIGDKKWNTSSNLPVIDKFKKKK